MTLLALLIGLWLALSVVGAALFVAFVRGSGGTEAAALPGGAEVLRPVVALPAQRVGLDAVRERIG